MLSLLRFLRWLLPRLLAARLWLGRQRPWSRALGFVEAVDRDWKFAQLLGSGCDENRPRGCGAAAGGVLDGLCVHAPLL